MFLEKIKKKTTEQKCWAEFWR